MAVSIHEQFKFMRVFRFLPAKKVFVVVIKYPFSFGAVEPELVVFVFAPSANKEFHSQSGCASFKSLTILTVKFKPIVHSEFKMLS